MKTGSLPPAPPAADAPQKLPWHTALTLLIAFAALYHISGGIPLLIGFAALMGASYILPYRVGEKGALRWIVRLFLLGAIVILYQEDPESSDALFGPARQRAIFGLFYAAEGVSQFWRQRTDPLRSHLMALLMAGMVFLTACNTMNDNDIRWWTPPFVLCLAFSLHTYRRHSGGRLAVSLRVAALVFTLFLGAVSYRMVIQYRGELLDLSNRLVGQRFRYESSGMSQQPQLGSTFGLRGSAQRVLRMQGYEGDAHLRGLSFDTYNGGLWGPGVRGRSFAPASSNDVSPAGAEALPGNKTVTVARLVNNNTLLYAPLNTAAIDLGEGEGAEWAPAEGGPLRVRARSGYEYLVFVPAKENYQGILAHKPQVPLEEHGLQIPKKFDARVRALALRIAGKEKTAPAKIEAVVTYLLSNYTYSLRFDLRSSEDPLSQFLLSEPKRGAHCEYFGTAAAMLLRCVGVPTRYVTGYYAHEGGGPGITVVRQRDAHAWCEAWVDGIGWVTVDATPGDGRPDHEPEPVERWRAVQEWFEDGLQKLAALLANLTPAQLNFGIGSILAGILLWGLWTRYRRRLRLAPAGNARFVYTASDAEVAALADRFEAVFARGGFPFPAHRTYDEHLALLARENLPDTRPLVQSGMSFARIYNRARFGGGITEDTLSVMQRTIEEMEQLPHDRTRR